MASLLVLALLALATIPALLPIPAIPTPAWAPMPEDHGHHAAYDPVSHDPGSRGADVAPVRPGGEGHPAGGHRGTHPALACCVAMHCPMLTGTLPGAPAQPPPPVEAPAAAPATPHRLAGLSIPPALPPPRAA